MLRVLIKAKIIIMIMICMLFGCGEIPGINGIPEIDGTYEGTTRGYLYAVNSECEPIKIVPVLTGTFTAEAKLQPVIVDKQLTDKITGTVKIWGNVDIPGFPEDHVYVFSVTGHNRNGGKDVVLEGRVCNQGACVEKHLTGYAIDTDDDGTADRLKPDPDGLYAIQTDPQGNCIGYLTIDYSDDTAMERR